MPKKIEGRFSIQEAIALGFYVDLASAIAASGGFRGTRWDEGPIGVPGCELEIKVYTKHYLNQINIR